MPTRFLLSYIIRIVIVLVQISNLETTSKMIGTKRLEAIKEELER